MPLHWLSVNSRNLDNDLLQPWSWISRIFLYSPPTALPHPNDAGAKSSQHLTHPPHQGLAFLLQCPSPVTSLHLGTILESKSVSQAASSPPSLLSQKHDPTKPTSTGTAQKHAGSSSSTTCSVSSPGAGRWVRGRAEPSSCCMVCAQHSPPLHTKTYGSFPQPCSIPVYLTLIWHWPIPSCQTLLENARL